MADIDPTGNRDILLDDSIRGVPPGVEALPLSAVGAQGWRPADGVMSLPVLTLDEAAYANNVAQMMRYVRAHGVEIAPHAKTPMVPELARGLVQAGAWGTTVADIRQAGVMLRSGLNRLVLANEVGGPNAARRLARLLENRPQAEVYVFADSVAAVEALAAAWSGATSLPRLNILVETGAGRAGARTLGAAMAVVDAVMGADGLVLSGVGTYEGSATRSTPEETTASIAGLLDLTMGLFKAVRARVGPERPLIATAGGSHFFDRIVAALVPLMNADGNATLVLRSGAIFFYDHGVYDRSMQAIDARQAFDLGGTPVSGVATFSPALRLWAEVLSRPEPTLALCGLGSRDTSFDVDLPMALQVYRDGVAVRTLAPEAITVTQLNDQHAFLKVAADDPIQVGDVIEFGISHPCTCIDRYRFIFGLDAHGQVCRAYPTAFG